MSYVVEVHEGKLRGQKEFDTNGNPFYSFLGIPYAKPPIGKLRFKPPEPVEKWEGVKDATKEGSPCYAYHPVITENDTYCKLGGSEDCLFLNIFTKEICTQTLKPVMVYIHGGAFTLGSSSRESFGPEYLLTGDVILVTLNYRLGALGFLKLENIALNCTGNAGLKDQLLALQWIKKNVEHFGGDSNNITIFGGSAGAVSVHYLILSPKAKGLFHKAIMASGSALSPWSRGVNNSLELAKILGYSGNDEEKLLEFLQNISAEKIVEAQKQFGDWVHTIRKRPFGPCIETQNSNSFLEEEPLVLIQSGAYNKVPLLLGYNNNEGILTRWFMKIGLGYEEDNHVSYHFQNDHENLQKMIEKFYFEEEEDVEACISKFTTDSFFLLPIYDTIKAMMASNPEIMFFYRISLDTELNIFKKISGMSHMPGVSHGDELGYLFKTGTYTIKPGSLEDLAVRRIVKMWTNFAKTGNPIPETNNLLMAEWKPVSSDIIHFLDIGEELIPGVNPDIERVEFWRDILKNVNICYGK